MNDFEHCAVRFRLPCQCACQRIGVRSHREHPGLHQCCFGAGQFQRKVISLPGCQRSFILLQFVLALIERVEPIV